MSALQTDRFKLRQRNVLSQYLAPSTREGSLVVTGNYGQYDDYDNLVIPAAAVGTRLDFSTKIVDYLYLDIEIHGNACAIAIYAPDLVLSVATDVEGTSQGRYVLRVPYCGPIEAMVFTLSNYIVKSITVVYGTDYTYSSRDLLNVTFGSTAGFTDDGETFRKIIADAGNVTVLGVNGITSDEVFGQISVNVKTATGFPGAPVSWTYNDGKTTWTATGVQSIAAFLQLLDSGGIFTITNHTGVDVIVEITPTVLQFKSISTAYSAEVA